LSDSRRAAARHTIGNLITLARADSWDAVTGSLQLLAFAGPACTDRLRYILSELVELTAATVLAKAEAMGMAGLFQADLRRPDESTVDIDSVEPPLRATLRAFLARINGRPEDATDQIELVLQGGYRATINAILVTLRWAINLLDWFRHNDLAAPDWFEPADGAA
jgi:hypothetical protein